MLINGKRPDWLNDFRSFRSPLGRSALCCSLRYRMFDIECLLYPQFNHCNVVRNLSTRSLELLAKVDVLKDMLVFTDHPNQCIGLFDTAEIAIAIKCICTA